MKVLNKKTQRKEVLARMRQGNFDGLVNVPLSDPWGDDCPDTADGHHFCRCRPGIMFWAGDDCPRDDCEFARWQETDPETLESESFIVGLEGEYKDVDFAIGAYDGTGWYTPEGQWTVRCRPSQEPWAGDEVEWYRISDDYQLEYAGASFLAEMVEENCLFGEEVDRWNGREWVPDGIQTERWETVTKWKNSCTRCRHRYPFSQRPQFCSGFIKCEHFEV